MAWEGGGRGNRRREGFRVVKLGTETSLFKAPDSCPCPSSPCLTTGVMWKCVCVVAGRGKGRTGKGDLGSLAEGLGNERGWRGMWIRFTSTCQGGHLGLLHPSPKAAPPSVSFALSPPPPLLWVPIISCVSAWPTQIVSCARLEWGSVSNQ